MAELAGSRFAGSYRISEWGEDGNDQLPSAPFLRSKLPRILPGIILMVVVDRASIDGSFVNITVRNWLKLSEQQGGV